MIGGRRDKIIAFDDGYFPSSFKSRKGYTIVAGVKTLNASRITGVAYSFVLVDSRETTEKIVELAKILGEADAIMLDGVTYAGFDVVDPDQVFLETSTPVIVIQQYPLSLEKIRKALIKNFADAPDRYSVVDKVVKKYKYLDTPWKTIQYYAVGISGREAEEIIAKNTIYSPVPEPLRIAHQIASKLSRTIIEIGGPAGI